MLTLGVISDTHVPDRARSLEQRALDVFSTAKVTAILHAGDISVRRVLDQLGDLAPVHAVRGNRDWAALGKLPVKLDLEFAGVNIGLVHGHGQWNEYLVDRVDYLVRGYRLEMFQPRLEAAFPKARVIVFGHTHRPLNRWIDGVLLFNPGSPHFPDIKNLAPSVGLLHLGAGGEVVGELVEL